MASQTKSLVARGGDPEEPAQGGCPKRLGGRQRSAFAVWL